MSVVFSLIRMCCQLRKEARLMNIVKYFTLVALAAAALGVSACAKKETAPPPAPAPTTGYSK